MKKIFDAIRAEFAHQDRRHQETSVLLGQLYYFQCGIRGFSHRLDTICGLARLSSADAKLQRTLRARLSRLLDDLSYAQTWGQLGDHPSLCIKDETGYLRATALSKLYRLGHSGNGYHARISDVFFEGGHLTFALSFRSQAGTDDDSWTLKPITLTGLDLDTLAGAAEAEAQLQLKMEQCLKAATESPEHLARQAAKKAKLDAEQARDTRISAHICKLLPADLAHCHELARGTSMAKYFAAARSF